MRESAKKIDEGGCLFLASEGSNRENQNAKCVELPREVDSRVHHSILSQHTAVGGSPHT